MHSFAVSILRGGACTTPEWRAAGVRAPRAVEPSMNPLVLADMAGAAHHASPGSLPIERITSPAALEPVLAEARRDGRCALDTEFVWERTYAPGLCLIQLATEGRLAVIDPLEGAPVEPVAALVGDPAVTKVMHAASGDLAAFMLHHNIHPAAILD